MNRRLNQNAGPLAHIRFRGLSRDVTLEALGVPAGSSDVEVRGALARFLEVSTAELAGHVLERHADGNVTLRPEAVFG
jgi:hypothetical protein